MSVKNRIHLRTFLLFALQVSFVLAAGASTLARMSLDRLVAAADAVARARCVGAESRWENGAIWTVTSFDVIETMKGALPARFTLRLPGGRVGHLTDTVDGAPRFNPGDEAVLFLERSRGGGFSVSGWVQGTFRIGHDPHTGQQTVTQDLSSFPVFDAPTRVFRAEGVRGMPMETFRERLMNAISRAQEKTR